MAAALSSCLEAAGVERCQSASDPWPAQLPSLTQSPALLRGEANSVNSLTGAPAHLLSALHVASQE